MKRLLCVWLPNWPIQRRRMEDRLAAAPDPQCEGQSDQARLLWDAHPRRGRLVVACCPRVRAARVCVGMSIAQAYEMCLAAGLENVTVERHDPLSDRQSLDQVAGRLQHTISPIVAIESLDDRPWSGHSRHQCESLILDIAGVTHLFGDEWATMGAVTELLASMGLAARLAIADTVGAAWAVAHTKIAKSHAAEDRCFIVSPGDQRSTLDPLSVSGLRVVPETVHTLSRLGVETIGHLMLLPRSGIAPRLGIALVRRIEQALGEVDEPIRVFQPQAEHVETLSLEYPTTDGRIVADRVGRLIEAVRAGLAARQRGAIRMTCRLDLTVHPPLTIDVGLFAPTADVRHLFGLIHYRLEQTRLQSDVKQITVAVTLTGPLRTIQTSLLDDQSDGKATVLSGSSISRLVDSLSARLGRGAVTEITLTNDSRPENAYQTSPLTGNQNSYFRKPTVLPRQESDSNPSPCDAIRRPLSLLSSPVAIKIAFGSDAFADETTCPSLPDRLRIQGATHRVARHWGPERIETDWWKGPLINRDYYRIETDRGQWCWIFRSQTPRTVSSPKYRWMLHGHFS